MGLFSRKTKADTDEAKKAKASMDFYAKIMDLTLLWIEQNGHMKKYQKWLKKNHGLTMGVQKQEAK